MPAPPTPTEPPVPPIARALPAFALRRPVTVVMVLVATVVLGAVALARIPLEMMPSGLTWPFLYVRVPYLNATPSEVERLIQEPVEDAISQVRGARRIASWARTSGADFWVRFEEGTDMGATWLETRERLERLRPQLPEDVGRLVLWKYNPQDMPVLLVGVSVEKPPESLEELMETRVARRIQRLSGVGNVEVIGVRGREVLVSINDSLARSHGLNVYEIAERLRRDGFALASGDVSLGRDAQNAGRRLRVRSLANIDDVQTLRRWSVMPGVSLEDIAEVGVVPLDKPVIHRVNGRAGVTLEVFRESGGNAVAISEAVREELARLEAEDPSLKAAGVGFTVLYDEGEIVRGSLSNLSETLIYGAVFALLVLLAFLRRLRITFIITAAVPVALTLTVIAMYFNDFSLNTLSMIGLMLSVGMVVDNAIVVAESIHARRQLGEDLRTAAVAGASQVALAIVSATATTVAAFLPLVVLSSGSTVALYVQEVAFPVSFALIASLVTALVIIPLASGLIPDRAAASEHPDGERSWVLRGYRAVLGWMLTRRADGMLITLLVLGSTWYPMQNVKTTDRVKGGLSDFTLRIGLPRGFDENRIESLLREVEGKLIAQQNELGIRDVVARYDDLRFTGRVRVFLDGKADTAMRRAEIIETARGMVPEIPGMDLRIGWRQDPTGDDAVRLMVTGPDSGRLRQLAEAMTKELEKLPEVLAVEPGEGVLGDDEIRLHIAREATARIGVSPLVVAGTVAYSLRGREAWEMHIGDRLVPVRVALREADRADVESLGNLPIPGSRGIPLGAVTRPGVAQGYDSIRHYNGTPVLELTVTTATDDLVAFFAAVDGAMRRIAWPRGYGYAKGERHNDFMKNQDDLKLGVLLAVLLVYLLMGLLLESVVLPLLIMFTVPFAFAGVYWLLFVTGTPFDDIARVGLIVLVGIVVNNAIVLLDLIVRLRRAGCGVVEAALEGGCGRMRAVMMTALTTIFGVVPMAIGDSGLGGIPYAPLGRVIIGGLISSTLLTLVLVPMLYSYVEDARIAWHRALRAVLGRSAPQTAKSET